MSSLLILAIPIFVLSCIYRLCRWPSKFPPGPPHLPLIGAALAIPKEKEWITYTWWKELYGSIVGLKALGQDIVLLNTSDIAKDILNNRADVYSSRPRMPMLELSVRIEVGQGRAENSLQNGISSLECGSHAFQQTTPSLSSAHGTVILKEDGCSI